MATSAIPHYTLNDFNELLFGNTFSFQLDKNSEEIIANLANILGIVNVNTENVPTKRTNSNRNPSYRGSSRKDKDMDDSWLQPAFKTTVIEKKDGTMHEIRTCLNKLSEKNYETNKIHLLELIRQLEPSNLPTIATNIFDIASTNKFYSEIYAKLYKELSAEFEIFGEILQTFVLSFTETMHNIHYVDQNKNYDEFCAYNKKNDMRKSTSVFIVNLVKNEVLPVGTLSNIVLKVQDIMTEYMNSENKTNEVEEITENLFLLIHSDILKHTEEWPIILSNVTQISQYKAKERASLSSRTIFKHLDILEKASK